MLTYLMIIRYLYLQNRLRQIALRLFNEMQITLIHISAMMLFLLLYIFLH